MKAKLFILILVASAVLACERNNADHGMFSFDREEEFALYESYYSADHQLSFSVDSIHDSRCPRGVYCIWQGQADVFLTVKTFKTYHLVLDSNKNIRDTIQNYEFQLIDVLPYPDLSSPSSSEDRYAIIKVSYLNN